MPGLSRGNMTYLNVKEGALRGKAKDGKELEYFGYHARVVHIHLQRDEYEGQENWRWRLKFVENDDPQGEKPILVSFNGESWFSQTFWARAAKVDWSRSFTLGCSQSEQNEKVTFSWLKQAPEEGAATAVITKDEAFPRSRKIKAGTKEIADYSDVWAAVERIFFEMTKKFPNLGYLVDEGAPIAITPSSREPGQVVLTEAPGEGTGKDDDLPF